MVSTPMTTTFAALPQLCMTNRIQKRAHQSQQDAERCDVRRALHARERIRHTHYAHRSAKAKKQPPTMKRSIMTLSTIFIACLQILAYQHLAEEAQYGRHDGDIR